MTDKLITAFVSVALAIIGLAGISVLLSQHANTSGVITAGSNSLSEALCTAMSPVTGGGCVANVTSNINFGSVVG